MCHICLLVPVCGVKACSPSAGRELTVLLSEHVPESFQCCVVDIYSKRGGGGERYFNSTTEISPVNALETNHWSASCQFALLFRCTGDDRSHHHFLSLHRSRCHILSFYLSPLPLTRSCTCLKVCLRREQSRFWR